MEEGYLCRALTKHYMAPFKLPSYGDRRCFKVDSVQAMIAEGCMFVQAWVSKTTVHSFEFDVCNGRAMLAKPLHLGDMIAKQVTQKSFVDGVQAMIAEGCMFVQARVSKRRHIHLNLMFAMG